MTALRIFWGLALCFGICVWLLAFDKALDVRDAHRAAMRSQRVGLPCNCGARK